MNFQPKPSREALEIVPRENPVKAEGARDAQTADARLGHGLKRLFEPIGSDPLHELDHLLTLLDRRSGLQK